MTSSGRWGLVCAVVLTASLLPLHAFAIDKLLIVNGTNLTMKAGQTAPFVGYILVGDDGKIKVIGKGNPPAGTTAKVTYDAKGKFVLPGFISAHSHLSESAFRGLARHVVTVSIPGEAASMGAGALYDAARAAGLDAAPAEDLEDAMLQLSAWARAHAREAPPRILICGSLYLAGKILAENG